MATASPDLRAPFASVHPQRRASAMSVRGSIASTIADPFYPRERVNTAVTRAYRESLRDLATARNLDVWSARLDVGDRSPGLVLSPSPSPLLRGGRACDCG